MKRVTILTGVAIFFATMIFTGCEKNPGTSPNDVEILPQSFKVVIPDAISRQASTKKSATVDAIKGNGVYKHLTTFIFAGENAANMVQEIIKNLRIYHINKAMSFSYTSDDDGRTKNLDIVMNSEYDGKVWEFEMTISDAVSEEEPDGGKALQTFWNRQPMEGIALLKPYNINRNENNQETDAMFRIDYSETGEHGYDAYMMVYASGLPLANPLDNPYSISSMKMFAGKKGDYVDVYGNSNHPNAKFFTALVGFNWAFVASGKNSEDIGVAEVGLPPGNLDEPSRSVLLGYYSIRNVFSREIHEVWPFIDSTTIASYLHNTEAPGFFDNHGFVAGGTSPGSDWNDLVDRIQVLSPYNPKEISNLVITFKSN